MIARRPRSLAAGILPSGLLGTILCGMPVQAISVTLQKGFTPNAIGPGGTTQLQFTVTNSDGAMARSDLGVVDTLPSGLRIAPAPSVGGTCANAAAATIASSGGTSISIFNLQVPAGPSSCTVTMNVTNAPGQLNADCSQQPVNFTNGASNVSVTNLTNTVSPSCLIVDRIFANGFEGA
ncbi:MAG TPA: hypothetical protein VHQ21_04455 [Rhodanobacteraceae bacterium]|nr:hypothetical protein [Rhodanobacteraceae bacterium]